jgi:DNA-binding HxlR family transcriptional regulator
VPGKINYRSDCPISSSLDIWGDKWSLLIIRNMMFYDLNTYGEFLQAPEKIATNILADRLVKLEEAGLIAKEEHPESKAKIFYKLTPMGISLLPVMTEISLWGDKCFKISPQAKAITKLAKKNKVEFIRSLGEKLSKTGSHTKIQNSKVKSQKM